MSFTAWTAISLVALGFGVGAFGTIVGAGGGFILTPLLLVLYPHDSAKTLTAISLVAVFFNASSGSLAYARQRRIDFRSGGIFALATLPGSIAGALLVGAVPRRGFDALMAVVLVALAIWLVISGRRKRRLPRGRLWPRTLTDRSGEVHRYQVPLARGAFYSVGVGFASSFFGIGGGVIHVPLLVGALGFPIHIATATSHFVLAIMAGSASLTHVLTGSFAHGHGLRRAASISVGVVVGAQVGARLSLRVRGQTIQLLLALALVVLAVRLLLLA